MSDTHEAKDDEGLFKPVSDGNDAERATTSLVRRAPVSHIGINKAAGEKVFGQELKEEYLRCVAQCGVLNTSAYAVGIHPLTALRHRKEDPEFAQAVELALELHREVVNMRVYERAIDGVLEPIIFQGQVTGYKRVFDNQLLLALAKKVDPGFREKQDVNVGVTAQVMVVPAPANSMEAMEAEAKRIAVEADR